MKYEKVVKGLTSIATMILLVSLLASGCGGGGGSSEGGAGGIDFDPGLNYVTEGDLTASQKDALRDLGLYEKVEKQFVHYSYDTESSSPGYMSMTSPIKIPKKLFMDKTLNAAKNLKGLAGKTSANEPEIFVVQGVNGVGNKTIERSCNWTNDLLNMSCDFTANVKNYDFYGACSQIVHSEGVLTCHIDMHMDNSSGKDSVAGYCLISDDMILTGFDGVQHKVTMAYFFDVSRNTYNDDYSESKKGWVKIDGASVKFDDLKNTPLCTNPSVIGCDPEDGSADALTDRGVTLLFDEEMNHASVEQAFLLESYDPDNYEYVPVAGSFSWNGAAVLFTPSQPLEYSTEYRVSLAGGMSAQGSPLLLLPFYSVFTTAGYPITVSSPISISKLGYNVSGIAWDGSDLWILDGSADGFYLYKIDASGVISGLKNVTFADYHSAEYLEWDGANFWSMDEGESPNQLVKIAADGSKAGSAALDGSYYDGLAFNNGNFSIYDSSNDMLATLDASGNQLSQKTIAGDKEITAITWCGDSYWMFDGDHICRINSELTSVDLSVAWLDTYEHIADATCDPVNKIIWVAAGWNNQEIYKIQLP